MSESVFSDHFRKQQAQEEVRRRNLMHAQIRNAIIEIENGELDDALARLKSLVGDVEPSSLS